MKIYQGIAFASILSVGLASAAHAGHWGVDYILYSGSSRSISRVATYDVPGNGKPPRWLYQTFDSDSLTDIYTEKMFRPHNEKEGLGPAPGRSVSIDDRPIAYSVVYDPAQGPADDPAPFSADSNNTMTVQPFFKWVPDNPDDKPTPTFYIYEIAMAWAHRGESPPRSTDPGYAGAGLEVVTLATGMEKEKNAISRSVPLTWWPGGPGLDFVDGKWRELVTLMTPNGKDTIAGPVRTQICNIKATNFPMTPISNVRSIRAHTNYVVHILDMSIKVRRLGTLDAFASEATVAAGAKDPDEHVAEIEVSTGLAADPNVGVPNYPLELDPQVLFGNGVQANALLTRRHGAQTGTAPNGDPIYAPLLTDDNGKVIIGTLRSSDKIKVAPTSGKKDKRVKVKLSLGRGENDPSAQTNQVWDGTWQYDEYFALDDPDPEAPIFPTIIFKPNVASDLIKGHTIQFRVKSVKVYDSTGNAMVQRTINRIDEPELVNNLAHFLQDHATESPAGHYMQTLRISGYPKMLIDHINFEAVDCTDWQKPAGE